MEIFGFVVCRGQGMTMADDPWTVPSLPWIEEIDMFVWQRELVYPFFFSRTLF